MGVAANSPDSSDVTVAVWPDVLTGALAAIFFTTSAAFLSTCTMPMYQLRAPVSNPNLPFHSGFAKSANDAGGLRCSAASFAGFHASTVVF